MNYKHFRAHQKGDEHLSFFARTVPYIKGGSRPKEIIMQNINKLVMQEQGAPTVRGHLIELEPWT